MTPNLWVLRPMLDETDACGFNPGRDAPLAQLVEQLTLNQRVRGSSPWRCNRKSLCDSDLRQNAGMARRDRIDGATPVLRKADKSFVY